MYGVGDGEAKHVTVRAIPLSGPDRIQRMAAHVHDLQADTDNVVLVTVNLGAAGLLPILKEAEVDLKRLHVVDAISNRDSHVEGLQVTYVGSPSLLELIAMRAQRLAGTGGHIVLCCIAALQMYNAPADVERFLHYLASRCNSLDISLDIMTRDDDDLVDDTLAPLLAKT